MRTNDHKPFWIFFSVAIINIININCMCYTFVKKHFFFHVYPEKRKICALLNYYENKHFRILKLFTFQQCSIEAINNNFFLSFFNLLRDSNENEGCIYVCCRIVDNCLKSTSNWNCFQEQLWVIWKPSQALGWKTFFLF